MCIWGQGPLALPSPGEMRGREEGASWRPDLHLGPFALRINWCPGPRALSENLGISPPSFHLAVGAPGRLAVPTFPEPRGPGWGWGVLSRGLAAGLGRGCWWVPGLPS